MSPPMGAEGPAPSVESKALYLSGTGSHGVGTPPPGEGSAGPSYAFGV